MSKRARALILAASLAAMTLAGMAVAQAQPPDGVEQFRRGERASQGQPPITGDARRPPTQAQVGESWRHPVNVPVRPAEPSGQPGWLVLGLGMLAAALALSGGLAAMILRRTRGRVRVRQVAACMCLWWHLMGPVRPLHVG
jgi:hypothetical protein